MKHHIGQTVRVKEGVMAPDDPELNLSGWQGRIIGTSEDENGDPLVLIEWDSVTLASMPKAYLEQSAREGLSWSEYYLGIEEVEPAQPRDSKSEAEQMIAKIDSQISWLSMGEEGKRIQAVLNTATARDEWSYLIAWSKHLREVLEFPFEAVVYEYQERGPLKTGDKLKVLGVEIEDDLYGVIVQCRQGKRRYDFPLCDLAVVNKHSPNAHQIDDYRVWFANR